MAENRTEQATPRRRQQPREKGQVLRSRDLVSAFTLLAVVALFTWHPEGWIRRWHSYFSHTLAAGALSDWNDQLPVVTWTALTVAQWAGPILAVAFCAAVLSTVAQGGVSIASEALSPNWSRLNPASNFQQLFSFAGLSRTLRSLLPSSVILVLALRLVWNSAPLALHSTRLHARGTLALMGQLCFSMAWQAGLVLLAWSGVDYLLQRQTFEKSLRMTKQDVQKATAVITNPTHYAVAIEYRQATMAAPVVVAKGRNLLAQKIKELARWHEVPIVENPPLAQALYKATDVGQMIPPKLYAAVAEILAFIYRAQMRMKTAAAGTQAAHPGAI